MQKIKLLILSLFLVLTGAVSLSLLPVGALGVASSVNVVADTTNANKCDAVKGLNQITGSTGCDTSSGSSGVGNLVAAVVTIISYIVGVAAIIMIIVSGFRFITAGGDSNKAASARTELAYALVGIAVAALAQFLAHFALNTAASSQPCPSNSNISANSPKCH